MSSETNSNDDDQYMLNEDKSIRSCEEKSSHNSHQSNNEMMRGFFKFHGFGMICAIMSAVMYSINALFIKLVHDDIHPVQLSLSRTYVQFLILLPILFYKRNQVDVLGPKGFRRLLWARGIIGSSAMVCFYLAANALSVGNAVTITYVSMIMVPFIARIFLKETLTVLDLVFAFISLIGVILIAQPTFLFPLPEGQESSTNPIGILYALLAATLQAISLVIVRKLGKTYAPLNVLYYSACGALLTTVLLGSLNEFQYPSKNDLPFVFSFGVLGVLGQFFLTLSLQLERAGTVSVLRSSQIIVVYVFQITILGDIPSALSLIGAGLVLSSSLGIGVRKILNERKRKKSNAKE